MHAYASTTPEARELVAELEFVWDQIKSNPASASSASSPDQRAQGSYNSRASQRPEEGQLRILHPLSEPGNEASPEDGGEDDQEFAEARSSPSPSDAEAPLGRDYDIRTRKWRRRIEAALVKLTAEVAALREQLEVRRRLNDGPRRRKGWVWVEWLVGALVRHVLVDAAVVGVLWLWFRGGGQWRVEKGARFLMGVLRERGGRIEGLRRRRVLGGG